MNTHPAGIVLTHDERRIPEWLAPYKAEWRSMTTMAYLFNLESRPLAPWLEEIRPRLRCVIRPSANGRTNGRYYLVKQVWAFSLAHRLKLLPSHMTQPKEDLARVFELKSRRLQNELEEERNRPPEVRYIKNPDIPLMLSAMLSATEPRPLPGIYFLISAGVVTYVGQSQNVLGRMSGHTKKSFDTVKMIYEPDMTNRLVEEGRWISAFEPRDNIAGLPLRKAVEA